MRALAGMTFESFIEDAPQRNAFKRAQQFAANPDGWLVIMGGYGTGKTHLAAAIGNYRLAMGEPALFMVVPDLLDHLRSAYAPGSELDYDDFFEGVRAGAAAHPRRPRHADQHAMGDGEAVPALQPPLHLSTAHGDYHEQLTRRD